MLLHDQPFLFSDPALSSDVESDDEGDDEAELDDAPDNHITLQIVVYYPLQEANHEPQSSSDYHQHEKSVKEHLFGVQWVVLLRHPLKVRPIAA